MRKVFYLTLIAAATLSLAACQKEIDSLEAITDGNEIQLNFSSIKPNLIDIKTKTAWTGETITWSKNDAIRVAYTVNDNWQAGEAAASTTVKAKLYASAQLTADAEVATFAVSANFKDTQNAGLTDPVYKFFAIYPSGLVSGTDFTNPPYVPFSISSEQTPKANSFDGALDVMYATSNDYDGIPADRNVDLTWYRIVSHADISMRNLQLGAGETLESITVTAQSGADLVGSHTLNITNGEVALGGATAGNSVTVKADNLTLSDGAVEFWFTSLPFSATELTFTARTDKYSYVRTFTGLNLQFLGNARNTLSVNMKKAIKLVNYEESFSEGVGDFTADAAWSHGTYSGTSYMKAQSTDAASGAWLVSPKLSILTNQSTLSFSQSINKYFGTIENEATVWAREVGGEWTKINITYPNKPSSGWSSFEETTASLSAYEGKTIQIGFKYVGTTESYGGWEISNFKVTNASAIYDPVFTITSATTQEVSFNASTVEFTYSASHLTSDPTVAIKAGSDDIIDGTPTIADGVITVNVKANNDEAAKTATLVVSCEGVNGIPELVINQAKKENLVEKSVTLDFSAQNYSNEQVVSSLTVAPVTAALDKGTNSNAPKYYTTGTAVRCYGGNTITLSSAKTIVKAVFTFVSGGNANEITSNVGTYTNGTWTGSSTSVTYTIGGTTGHRRIQKIEVTYMDEAGDEPTPQTPVITLSNVPTENISAEGDVVTINYQIENPVSGVTVSAAPASGDTWVNTFDYDTDGAISFFVDPKTTTGTRTTTITVSYTGAESKTFEITQDGATSGSGGTISPTEFSWSATTNTSIDDGSETATDESGTTVSWAKGTSSSTKVALNTDGMRLYSGSTFTVANANKKISKIEFTIKVNAKSGKFPVPSVTTGSLTSITSLSKSMTWEGSSNTIAVSFSSESGNVAISKIVVTYEN